MWFGSEGMLKSSLFRVSDDSVPTRLPEHQWQEAIALPTEPSGSRFDPICRQENASLLDADPEGPRKADQ